MTRTDQPVAAAFAVVDLEHLGQPRPVGEDLDRVEALTWTASATTGPPRSPRPAATTRTRRTRDPRAAASRAAAGRPAARASVDLRRRVRPDHGVEHGVRAALGQRHQPGLRERRLLTLVHPRPPEERRRCPACRRHRDRSRRSPPAAAPPATPPASPAVANGRATRSNNASQRLRTQPVPGLEDRRLRRQHAPAPPPRRPRQPVGQLRQHVLIRALRVQRHPDREVRHHPRRQRPMPLLGPPAPRRSPHPPTPAGTPASTPPPTPDPTTDDPTPASPTQHEASTQTTPL